MNVRLRMYKYCSSNLGAIYAKGLCPCIPGSNRPFPRSLLPLFLNESKCETIHMKIRSVFKFIVMQMKLILI